ncbi:MAG: ComF family protein [Silicimonas sp.]
MGMQRALALVYPDQCILCPEPVEASGGLCSACWRDMPFIRGLVCEACGTSLPGEEDRADVFCDDCMTIARPWNTGRAALSYRGMARRLILALKHGDRPDLASPAAEWLERAGGPVLRPDTLLVPVPIHWSRMLSRRYNQSAELCRALSRRTGIACCPSALIRTRRTPVQDGLGVDERFTNLLGAVHPHPRRGDLLRDRDVCLIDDVMTSGATLSVSSQACLDAGARRVSVLVLARVEKAP